MTTSNDMIRGRSNVVTLTNNSGGALIAGDVCIQDTSADENVTVTTTAADTKKVFIAAESVASGAAGRFYESGYCPYVKPNASVTRGQFLFTDTVAKQATASGTYGAGAFGKILKTGTTPSAIIYSATAQLSGGAGSDTTAVHTNVANEISTITEKTSLANDDLFIIEDSAAAGVKKKVKKSNVIAGGGGNVTTESTFASPPATPASGDLWFISDGRLHGRYNGSAWSYYYGTRHVTPPAAAQSWVNQGSATITDTGDLTLFCPAVNADNLRGRVMTAPSLNYTIDVIMIAAQKPATDTFGCYIGWSNGTALVTYGIGNTNGSGGPFMEVIKWTNSTTFSAAYAGSSNAEPFIRWVAQPIYLRIQEDSSNRTCSYSFDQGRNYIQFHQVGRTDFLTATQVGFFVFNHHATLTNSQVILDWTIS